MLFADIDEIIDGTAKPMTNADRIRAMSDEELAKLLEAQGCPSAEDSSCYEHTCEDCWLEWLKQPAEGE